ncbi:hypothetical protein HPB51_013949 [Rhipicephalus microplus]|uniref:Uncharacterized protein n=1 Tax=Rhipicephalus microplus TaxID=6941 RepID=A0A9J6DH05_RHIMP|nr:hypothetical protein HPB51_013949 [Rhipicephalus microplus]
MTRTFWNLARRVFNRAAEFPASYPFGYVSPDDKALMYWTPASFGKVVRQPGQKPASPIKPGRPSLNGRFAQTPLPRSALGSSYGTVVRSPSEKAALRRQMAAATGAWGPFPPDRGSDAGVVSKTRVLYRSEQATSAACGGLLQRELRDSTSEIAITLFAVSEVLAASLSSALSSIMLSDALKFHCHQNMD